MGRAPLDRPRNLSKKLLEVRQALGLSQNGIIKAFGLTDSLTQAEISAFEMGKRVPPLLILLRYARALDIHVDDLIDDGVELKNRVVR